MVAPPIPTYPDVEFIDILLSPSTPVPPAFTGPIPIIPLCAIDPPLVVPPSLVHVIAAYVPVV